MNKYFRIQFLVLLIGTVFAWSTVYSDFARFYNAYGTLTRVNGCIIPNPVTTPCFYGAFAFLGAFIWSYLIWRRKLKNVSVQQKRLNFLLIAGTVFAWGNFIYEAVKYYLVAPGSGVSCSGVPTKSVFLTPCFYGAAIFLTALIISMKTMKTFKKD